jgi:hypothetical protein
MWRIIDHTKGKIRAALQAHWNGRVANDVLEHIHGYGAAMDIAHELIYLGFERHKDFDIDPARMAMSRSDVERISQNVM